MVAEGEHYIFPFLAILLAFVVLFVGNEATESAIEHYNESCNEKYGENNWTYEETTGKHLPYIGQSWECVPKEVSK